jgi:transcriptional regulator with XRE-family HTH domain
MKMKTTKDYLNAVKAKTGAVSDYALAQKLGTSKQLISLYMQKHKPMGDEIALKVAEILEIDESEVLISAHIERTQSETVKNAYKSIFERLGGIAASVVVSSALLISPSISSTCIGIASCQCILC